MLVTVGNSHPVVLCKKGVLRISQNLLENICARVFFFDKVAGLATLLNKRFWLRCFPVNFAKFLLRTSS